MCIIAYGPACARNKAEGTVSLPNGAVITFTNIGDKALSVGEGSELTVQDSHVLGASIAMAAKDRSTAIAERLRVDAVENFVFASYIKKPEFGAATLRASELRWAGEGAARHLAQTGCTIVVDGVAVPPRDLDVEQLYRDRVLGK